MASEPHRPNGIQVLPVMWRQDVKFGMAADDEEEMEADLGMLGVEDGCPTLDELTLEGVPNIRTVVSDVLLDAFDMLTLQPMTPPDTTNSLDEHAIPTSSQKLPPLLFPVQNFFAAGSPLGVILLLRGFKIASRKSLNQTDAHIALSDVKSPSPRAINLCYPASDPVAYRIEPLIARHYSAKLKPEPIPYMKGGLKGVIDASFNMGSGIANRAGAMYESFKMGLTTSLFMRGLGLSRQQIYEDTHPQEVSSDHEAEAEEEEEERKKKKEEEKEKDTQLTRIRSNSDPVHTKLPTTHATPYLQGAKKIKMLNETGRVDYCIQEGLLENPYLSAFSAHMQYWQVR
ncbi:hypothetical protein CU098_008070 [Rhizopus stolonifer]|uniref:DDHD domain-containing protein n=1 Tax=Rhizopus stolonifer TaxID=4846 RepID=A0A367J8P1_RHIST|nr:hypothetical protein CU098_008070 [Rhizopus stolonifer]